MRGSYSRIDLLCVLKQYTYKVVDCKIGSITISDHAPIILTLELGTEKSFKYWRANISLLTDNVVTQEIRNCIKEYFDHNDNSEVTPSTLWDGAKAVIMGKMIEISSRAY